MTAVTVSAGLLAFHAGDTPVSFAGARTRSADDLLHDIARLVSVLPPAGEGSQVLSVVRHDHYALACVALAAMVRGHTLTLPPETGREAITAIAADPRTLLIAHDTPSSVGLKVDALLNAAEPVAPITRAQLASATLHVRVFERDGHGATEKCASSSWLSQAQAACARLRLTAGTRLLSTVAPGQPYNIVLGILAPLLSGGAFARTVTRIDDLEDVLAQERPDVLLSVPATLRTLSAAALPPSVRVISSLSPLALPLARALGEDRVESVHFTTAAGIDSQASATRSDPASTLEAFLLEQPGVDDAAVVRHPRVEDPAFVVVFSGNATRTRLRDALSAQLGPQAADVQITRLVRVPRDSTGRYARADILRFFRLRSDGTALNFELPIPPPQPDENTGKRVFQLDIPADYAYYDGHFTGYPILAGAVQLGELVLPCVRVLRPELGMLTQVTRLKFTGRIQPGERIELELAPRDTGSVDFVLKRGSTLCASGSLQFAQPGASA